MPDSIMIEGLYTDCEGRLYGMDSGVDDSSAEGNRLLRFTGNVTGGDFAFECRRREPARSGGGNGNGAREVRASINARVAEVVVQAGARVQPGDRLVVLEAMKMEHEVRANRDATVAEVGVRAGEQVVPGQVIVRYEGET